MINIRSKIKWNLYWDLKRKTIVPKIWTSVSLAILDSITSINGKGAVVEIMKQIMSTYIGDFPDWAVSSLWAHSTI